MKHLLLCLALVSFCASGQTTPKQLVFNQHAWFSYSGDHRVSGPWGVHFDGQWRRSDLGLTWQQYQLRPGLNYEVSDRLLLTVGYAYTRTYPYNEGQTGAAYPEHRIYQQALVRHNWNSLRLQHRIRMEERFIKSTSSRPESWRYQNRFRYSAKVEVPISRKEDGRMEWYLPAYDEIFIGIPPNYGARPFDQNRLFVGIGHAFDEAKIEVGYLNQFIGQRNGRVFEFNNTLFVAVSSNFDLSELWR
jgi:hypothetical protein